MDPDATLRRYWDALLEGDLEEAADAKRDLLTWIRRGGFEPNWKASGHSRAAFMGKGSPRPARWGSK